MKNQTPRTDEFARAECCDLEHALDFARDLERELQHATTQLGIRISALVERNFARLERGIALEDLANERALADRLADALSDIQAKCCDTSIALHPDADAKGCVDDCWEWSEQALAAWKEARRGTD